MTLIKDPKNFILNISATRTMSTIALVKSYDGGLTWTTEVEKLISPQLEENGSWKQSYVYGFDTIPGSFDDSLKIQIVHFSCRSI